MTSMPTASLHPHSATEEGVVNGESSSLPLSNDTSIIPVVPAPIKGKKRATPSRRSSISKRAVSEYFSAMETAVKANDVEKAVENATTQMLRSGLAVLYPDSSVEITYPHGTDGLITVRAPEGSLFSPMEESTGATASGGAGSSVSGTSTASSRLGISGGGGRDSGTPGG